LASTVLSGPDILIVEDQAHMARLLQFVIEREGFTVDIAYDGEGAERKLASTGYKAVLLDLDLPGRSGLELIRSIRSIHYDEPPCVIVLSGMCSGTIAEEVINAGANVHYQKPMVPATLLRKMRELGVSNQRFHEAPRAAKI
jgi:DNA-binding response OmpR family regulator